MDLDSNPVTQVVLDEDVKKLSKLCSAVTSSFANDFEEVVQKQKLNRLTRTEDVPGDLLALDYLLSLSLREEGDTDGPDFRKSMNLLDRPALADELPGSNFKDDQETKDLFGLD